MLFQKALLLACLLMSFNLCFAQKVATIISKDKIVLGEQITLQIKIEGIDPAQVKEDFNFPDSVNHIEILSDSLELSNSVFVHTLILTSFDSGYWELPVFTLLLSDNRKLTTQPVGITVLPVDVSNLQDYHDIKDILEVEAENNWWVIAIIVALMLISLFAFLWFNNRQGAAPAEVIPTEDLEELYKRTLIELKSLEYLNTDDRETIGMAFKNVSAATRQFTDAAYKTNTVHLTTGEYILQMKSRLPDAETATTFFQFLRLADAIKFAKYIPPAGEIQPLYPALNAIIISIYQQSKNRG